MVRKDGSKHVKWKELDYSSPSPLLGPCIRTCILISSGGDSRFERNQQPRRPVMRIGDPISLSPPDVTKRRGGINCLVVLVLTRFRFQWSAWHDIISFIFVSCLRKPTGAEVFICFSHSSGRPPRTGASRSVVGTDIPVDSHPRPPIPILSLFRLL